jgi:hypothetical protein
MNRDPSPATGYEQLASRLVDPVSKRLGVPVSVIRWDMHKTGARVPVFGVPASHVNPAKALGLSVEAV